MFISIIKYWPRRVISLMVMVMFLGSLLAPSGNVLAQSTAVIPGYGFNLPIPGTMVRTTSAYVPAMIKAIKFDPQNPLQFNFILDTGHSNLSGDSLKQESEKLIKYFLTSLTVPADKLWVNLSPYEQDRIIPEGFDQTEMGRDLLAQDYILKQLTASLMYPEEELGQEFWERVYSNINTYYKNHPDACLRLGRDPDCNVGAEIPVNTFNKVWIVPERAKVMQSENMVLITESHLKVMLEEDYEALSHNKLANHSQKPPAASDQEKQWRGVSSDLIRTVLIPEIEREVNEGKNFANLRQIFNSMILAAWYKQNLKTSFLNKAYADQNKTQGITAAEKNAKEKIYAQYLEAFNKGVYDYIREDYDATAQEIIQRHYFSGGVTTGQLFTAPIPTANPVHQEFVTTFDEAVVGDIVDLHTNIQPQMAATSGNEARAGEEGQSASPIISKEKNEVNQTIEDLLKNKYKLSPREIEITKLLARGILTNKLIAQDVRIEESTVGSHIGDISGKMKIDDPFYAIVSIVSIVNEYMRKAEGFLREVYRDDLYKYFGIELGYQEFDVFKKIVDGHTDYEIINELNLKQKKLDSILNELYRKMEITNQFRDQRRRASLVIKYFQYVRMLDEKIKLELQARTKYAKLDIPFPKVEKNYKKGLDVGFEKSLNDTKQWLEKEFGFENEIIDIVLFIASGLDNKTIAKRLAENEKIVAGKRREIYKKMKVSVSTQVTSVVYQNPYARNLLNKLDYVDIKTKLNDSEYQTLEGMAKGMDLLSIARTSGRTLRDVVKEVKEIRRKLGVKRNNIEAVKLYYRYQFDQSSSALESTDEAQAVGGIDLNTELLKLETEGEAIEFELPDELRNIDINAINGFTPIIQQMIPVTNLYMLLGSGEEREKGDTQDISFNRSIDPFVTKKRF